MAIWRCASGGYHQGKDCYEEFGRLMKHTKQRKDVELVRLPSVDEVVEATNVLGWTIPDETVAAVLESLVRLTPTNKKEWDELHNATA